MRGEVNWANKTNYVIDGNVSVTFACEMHAMPTKHLAAFIATYYILNRVYSAQLVVLLDRTQTLQLQVNRRSCYYSSLAIYMYLLL